MLLRPCWCRLCRACWALLVLLAVVVVLVLLARCDLPVLLVIFLGPLVLVLLGLLALLLRLAPSPLRDSQVALACVHMGLSARAVLPCWQVSLSLARWLLLPELHMASQ